MFEHSGVYDTMVFLSTLQEQVMIVHSMMLVLIVSREYFIGQLLPHVIQKVVVIIQRLVVIQRLVIYIAAYIPQFSALIGISDCCVLLTQKEIYFQTLLAYRHELHSQPTGFTYCILHVSICCQVVCTLQASQTLTLTEQGEVRLSLQIDHYIQPVFECSNKSYILGL